MAVFIPRNRKYQKNFKLVRSMRFAFCRPRVLYFGSAGLQAQEGGSITSNQMESVRRALVRFLRPYKGKFKLYLFAAVPLTKKPVEVRMGKGKGNVNQWVQRVRRGALLLEVGDVATPVAITACKYVQIRLGVATRVVNKLK